MPALIHSAHVIQHPGLRQAVAADLGRERSAVRAEIAELSMHGPFKRDNADE
jgi:predicted N-acyltransferase